MNALCWPSVCQCPYLFLLALPPIPGPIGNAVRSCWLTVMVVEQGELLYVVLSCSLGGGGGGWG